MLSSPKKASISQIASGRQQAAFDSATQHRPHEAAAARTSTPAVTIAEQTRALMATMQSIASAGRSWTSLSGTLARRGVAQLLSVNRAHVPRVPKQTSASATPQPVAERSYQWSK